MKVQTTWGRQQLLTFPPGRPSSSKACITIFSVLPEAKVRVILLTGILLFGFLIKHNFNQLQQTCSICVLWASNREIVLKSTNDIICWCRMLIFWKRAQSQYYKSSDGMWPDQGLHASTSYWVCTMMNEWGVVHPCKKRIRQHYYYQTK